MINILTVFTIVLYFVYIHQKAIVSFRYEEKERHFGILERGREREQPRESTCPPPLTPPPLSTTEATESCTGKQW